MKKIFLVFALFSCLSSFSQKDLRIIEDCTDLSGKCYIYASHTFVIANAEKDKGFKLDADFKRNEETQALEVTGFLCKLVNIGTCSEKNELILLFEDGSKFTIYSWNKWNCDGDAWYYLNKAQVETLATKKLVKAQMKNGYSFESYMNTVEAENQNYFMRLISDANQNKVELQK
jgi:hypothetical protein